MRIGSSLLLHRGQCIQSYEWKNFRPLGSLQLAMDSLEEYGVDEVAIIRPVRSDDSFRDYCDDLDLLKDLKTMTPISFGGGIRSLEHLSALKKLPIERLIFSSSFINKNRKLIQLAQKFFGPQAIQCLLPLINSKNDPLVYNTSDERSIDLLKLDLSFINEYANEIILYDIEQDGKNDSFQELFLNMELFDPHKLIITGGVGAKVVINAQKNGLASVLFDNRTLHQEYSIKKFKK